MAFNITQDDLLDLLGRTMDEQGWLQPILDHPDSRIILEAVIAVVLRAAEAASRGCDVGLISTAPAGVVGSSQVSIQKEGSFATLAGTLPAGTRLVDARGFAYTLPVDVAIPAGTTFATSLSVVSLRKTELVNTVDDPDMRFANTFFVADASNAVPIVVKTSSPHNYVTGDYVRVTGVLGNTGANGVFQITVLDDDEFELDGSSGTGVFTGTGGIVQPAPFTLIITEATPTQNALSDYLSVLAAERGLQKQTGETDALFRQRVLQIPDAVSPCAISEVVLSVTQNLGLANPQILEPFDLGETQSEKDAKVLGTLGNLFFDAGTGFFDDPIQGQMNSLVDFTGHFVVRVSPGDINTATGSFFDSEKAFFDGLFFFDSNEQLELETALATLRAEIDAKRAHAVGFELLLSDVIKRSDAVGDTTGAGVPELVWSISPSAAGKAFHLWHVLTGISSPVLPLTSISQFIKFTFDDATTYDLPTQTFLAGESGGADVFTISRLKELGFPFKPITLIEGFAEDDSVNIVRMVSHLWMVEFEL